MDVKRPLLTQVPSQTDVGVQIYDYRVRRFKTNIGLRIEFDGCEEALLTQVPSQTDVGIQS
eukprot:scaffold17705_cov37-Attheya_sp.AAC.1